MALQRGRQVFMDSLRAHGVSAIFGNPGTTENPLLDSLIDHPDLPYYVALHEGVAAGAATVHALATGKPSVVNLHVAPGLGNAIGMVYGALKACAPVLVTAGQQDLRMRLRDPLLSHDLVAMARPVTKWAAEPQSADEVATLTAQALSIAMTPPRGPVFLSMPVDVFAGETGHGAFVTPLGDLPAASAAHTQALIEALEQAEAPAILAGDDVTTYGGFGALVQVAERSHAKVYLEGLRAHTNFPNRHPAYGGRIPFEAGNIRRMLSAHDLVLMIGSPFFEEIWHDDIAPIPEGVPVIQLEQSTARLGRHGGTPIVADIGSTLSAVAEALPAVAAAPFSLPDPTSSPAWDATPMSPKRALHELAAALPDDVVLVDESITAYPDVASAFDIGRPHAYYAGRGGGIGQGLAGAIGAQVAHPAQTVVAISGDGSAMYSIQALWSAAHHNLPILFVILANREYRVLKHNLDIYRARFEAESNRPYPHMDLDTPTINFVEAAAAQGVSAARVETPGEIAQAVADALASPGPALLELVVAGKR